MHKQQNNKKKDSRLPKGKKLSQIHFDTIGMLGKDFKITFVK